MGSNHGADQVPLTAASGRSGGEKLGVTPWDLSERSAASLSAQAAAAERYGYASFWLPENHFNDNAIPDPLMLLAAVAAGTRDIRLATTSYLLPLRNPVQAAEQVAVLDQLSCGRVVLGVGRGYAPLMLKAFNVVPRDKRRLFEDSLRWMIDAWSGVPVAVGGSGDARIVLDPLPVQKPHPPIWVAAFGPKALAQAGRLGLPYLASPVETLATLEANYERHRAAARDAGHEDQQEVPVMRTLLITRNGTDADEVRRRVHEQALGTGRLDEGAEVDDWCIIGEAAFVRDKVAEYRERLGMSHLIVTRLRVGGVDRAWLERSVAEAAELLG